MKRIAVASWIVAGLLSFACSSGPRKEPDNAAAAFQSLEQRLQGAWRVVSFIPETALLPALRELLAFQYDQLVVRIKKGRVRANSAGVKFDRAYRIEKPLEERFTLIISDEQGLENVCLAKFDATDQLVFQSLTDPWKGSGVLRRIESAPPR